MVNSNLNETLRTSTYTHRAGRIPSLSPTGVGKIRLPQPFYDFPVFLSFFSEFSAFFSSFWFSRWVVRSGAAGGEEGWHGRVLVSALSTHIQIFLTMCLIWGDIKSWEPHYLHEKIEGHRIYK